jgi:hypothetical protein
LPREQRSSFNSRWSCRARAWSCTHIDTAQVRGRHHARRLAAEPAARAAFCTCAAVRTARRQGYRTTHTPDAAASRLAAPRTCTACSSAQLHTAVSCCQSVACVRRARLPMRRNNEQAPLQRHAAAELSFGASCCGRVQWRATARQSASPPAEARVACAAPLRVRVKGFGVLVWGFGHSHALGEHARGGSARQPCHLFGHAGVVRRTAPAATRAEAGRRRRWRCGG